MDAVTSSAKWLRLEKDRFRTAAREVCGKMYACIACVHTCARVRDLMCWSLALVLPHIHACDIYACVNVYMYGSVCVCVSMHVCVYMCIHTDTNIHTYVYTYKWEQMRRVQAVSNAVELISCVREGACGCACICVCLHTCICMDMHNVFTCIFMYTYTHRRRCNKCKNWATRETFMYMYMYTVDIYVYVYVYAFTYVFTGEDATNASSGQRGRNHLRQAGAVA